MKKIYIKKAVLTALISCYALFSAIAQTQTYQQEADQVLLNLNKVEVTTGILYDRVFPLANLQNFQGLVTDDTTNTEHFHQAYYELYNAMLNNNGYQTPEALNNYLINHDQQNEHNIGLMMFNYNYLDTNAIKNNQLYSSGGLLYDNSNRSTSPWLQKTFFIATPLLPAESVIKTGEHTFNFDPNLILSNTPVNIASITVNFDDGYGDQQLYSNGGGSGGLQTLSIFSKVARFLTSRTFLVRLTVVLTNGQIYKSISTVRVKKEEPFKTIIDGCNGGDEINITGLPINASQYGGGLENAEGKAYIFYSNANCGTGKISKPIIFLDGFDPSNDRGVQQIYDEYLNKTININGVDVKLGDKLRADGYDIIIFDYKDGGDFIEKNAMAVISLLQQLQFNFGTNTKEDYVLIGPSMGALVAQYALAYAEANQIATHTRLFISFDGPHQGANAPIGIQNLIDYIFQKGISSAVFKKLKNGIHRVPSAKQMLVHHSSANSEIPAADNFRSIFLNNLQAVNNYPTQLRKVAIINGSNNLSPNEYFQSTDEILYLRVKRSGLLGLVNGKLGDRLNVNIKASPSNGTVATTDVWLFSPLLNLFLWRGPSFVKSTQPTQNNFSYDKAVGSYFTDPVNERTDAWINIGQTLLYLSAGNKSTFRHNINPTFMPTTSAMDLQSNNFSLAYNFSDENIVCTGKTPFDRVYAPTSNQPHVQITSENAVWFDNEIKGDTSSIQPGGIGNIIIEGSSQICNSAETFTVPNLTAGATVNWTVYASSGVVSYSISGNSITLTKTGNGQVNLGATIITACGNFNLPSKNINVGALILGMPSFTNSDNQSPYWCSNNSSGNSFTIETNDLSASYEVKILTYPSLNLYASYDNIYPGNDIYSNVPPGYYIFQIRAIGACGTSDWVETEVESLDCSMNNYRTGNFNIYPNPANNELNLEFQYYGNTREIKVLNDKGDVLISSQTKKGEKTSKLNTKDLKNGTYYLHLTDEKKTIKKQIIIAH